MNKIKCPHCAHTYTDDDMLGSNNDLYAICPDEMDAEEKCPLCGNVFWIRGSYKPIYITAKTEYGLDDI